MTFDEYITKIGKLMKKNDSIAKQLRCLESLEFTYIKEKYQVGQEYRATFDLPDLLEEYSWKAHKCQYFLGKYLDRMWCLVLVEDQ